MKTLIEKLREAREAMTLKAEELKVLSAKEDYTDEDDAKCEILKTELSELKTQIEKLSNRNANAELGGTLDKFLASHEVPNPLPIAGGEPALLEKSDPQEVKVLSPANYHHVALQNIKGEINGVSAHDRALDFGMAALANLAGSRKAREYCDKRGISKLTANEGDNTMGAYFIPTEISPDLIILRAKYGLFRGLARVENMTSDAKKVNVHQDGLVVYPIGESEAPDFSDTKYQQIGLVAKKFGVATKETEEFNADSIMSWADAAVRDIAYAFAKDEDDHGFNGDGSQAYHGIWGIGPKLQGLDATPANIASIKVGSGNAWSELVLSDFNGMKAKLPTYTYDMGGIGWFCSSAFYYSVMEPLMLAAGGNKAIDLADGADARFLGFPVRFVNSMPAVEANSQICCYFGAINLAVLFGDRAGVELKVSDQVRFMEGELVMRAIERYDINYWNTGNVSSDAALQVAGPIIGLQTAAS